ncbi:MAG: cytochrome C oxidase assembly protein [Pseudomonadota bacterium]
MALRPEHEMHQRRKGRNTGVAVLLVSFVVLILALTVVKVTDGAFELPRIETADQ